MTEQELKAVTALRKLTEERDEAVRKTAQLQAALEDQYERLRSEVYEARAKLAAIEASCWRCFHCGFETADRTEAAGHFGDRDDEEPICLTWESINADGKLAEWQATCAQLLKEQAENADPRQKIEGLEYRLEVSELDIAQKFKGARSFTEAWQKFDFMEGRALLAEAHVATLRAEMSVIFAIIPVRCTVPQWGNDDVWRAAGSAKAMALSALTATPTSSLIAAQRKAIREWCAAIGDEAMTVWIDHTPEPLEPRDLLKRLLFAAGRDRAVHELGDAADLIEATTNSGNWTAGTRMVLALCAQRIRQRRDEIAKEGTCSK
jgi:hypothetical protein